MILFSSAEGSREGRFLVKWDCEDIGRVMVMGSIRRRVERSIRGSKRGHRVYRFAMGVEW